MTRILLTAILLFCFSAGYISAQNVGVDVASPVEKLDVLGAIRIGNTSNTNAGAIRWNSPNFQGYDGTQWVNFGGGTLTGSGTATRVAFWDGTNSLSSNTNLYWDNTNSRLGIGTATPSYTLQIYHTATNQGAGFFRVDNSSNNGSAVFASTNGGGSSSAIYAVNNGWGRAANFEINNSASDRHAIYASTNGIGHTIRVDQAGSGGRALYLQTGSSSNNNPTLYSNTFGTGYAGEFRIDNSGSSSAALYASTSGTGPAIEAAGKLKSTTFQMTASPTVNYVLRSDAAGNATWVNPNTLVTGLLPAGTTGQTIRHDGANWVANSVLVNNGTNVGIGTTAPDYKLHVSGSDYLALKITAPNSPLLKLSGSYNSGNGAEFWQDNTGDARLNINGTLNAIYMKSSGDVGIGIAFPATPSARLDVNNGTTTVPILVARDNGTEVFRIADGGNVGIGTATPTLAKLQVQVGGGGEGLRVIGTATQSGLNPVAGFWGDLGSSPDMFDKTVNIVNSGASNNVVRLQFTDAAPGMCLSQIESRYNGGAPYLAFRTSTGVGNITEKMRILANGNVGIGSTAPSERLDVSGKTKTTTFQMITSPVADYVLRSDVSGNATWVDPNTLVDGDNLGDHTATQNIELNNNWLSNGGGSEGIRVDNNGNIGIGLVPGSAYLDITGTNAGTSSLQLRSGNTGNGTSSNQLLFGYSGAETYRHAIKTRHNSSGITNNSIDFYLWDYANDALGNVGTNAVMTIAGDLGGSVGIGTTNPSSALDVRRSSDTDGDAITFGTPTYFMGRLGETATTNKVYLANTYNSDASYIDFRLKGNAESNSKMVIKGDGNVGIGTTSPVSKLHVSGATFTLNGYNTNPIELISGGSLPVFKWYGNGNLYFSNDPNTSNIGNEAVGTTQVMVLTPSGNVGIGTTSPSANLDVVGTVEMFGAWTSRSANTVYQAATDGFIIAWAGGAYFKVITDGSSTPTTVRMEAEGNVGNASRPNAMCPVRKGDYWKVEGTSGGTPTVWWMPLGQ